MEKQNDTPEERTENQSPEQMDTMLNDSLKDFKQIRSGEVVRGRIIKVEEDGYHIDINYKMEGFLPTEEDSLLGKSQHRVHHTLEIDDEIEVYIVRVDEKNGQIHLSRERARYITLWDRLFNAFKNKKSIEGEVIEKNSNGLMVDIGVKAFVPLSQVEQRFITEQDLEKYVGKKLSFLILKLDKAKNNVVLSHCEALEKERESMRQKTLANLKVGQISDGKVVNITDFGAFVDIGGIEGLLHLSEITWKEIRNPLSLIQKGDEVKVKVIDFNKEQKRISLSIKQLNPNPWDEVEKRYSVGDEVEGKVISIKDFGAFIELEEGLNGLLHISDMSWAYTRTPQEVLAENETVKVRVLDINKEERKMSLGLKQLMADPWTNIEEKYALGNTVEGKITQVTSYGANVELEPGVSGIIHLSEIDWKYIERPSSILKKYAVLPLKVIKIDEKDRLLFLSRKQALPNPWIDIEQKYKINDTVKAVVQRLKNFGVFVSLDEKIEGFIPFSEITWEDIKHPNQVLKKGDELELKIIEIDPGKFQITLSRKQLLPNPWTEIKKKYGTGTIVEGKVVNITDFGVFVNLEKNIDGLVPLSEISPKRIEDVNSVLAIGDTVQALVTRIDDRRKKISLSIRRAEREAQKRLVKDFNKQEGNEKILLKDVFGDILNFKEK
ncbi:MAG: S1 RNA-binding domain-containing protein [Candidatus Atribacteria bacterium]|nr:S1 RNA-binding domain-containing protein [Candidatus Atribacteria bacterium]